MSIIIIIFVGNNRILIYQHFNNIRCFKYLITFLGYLIRSGMNCFNSLLVWSEIFQCLIVISINKSLSILFIFNLFSIDPSPLSFSFSFVSSISEFNLTNCFLDYSKLSSG